MKVQWITALIRRDYLIFLKARWRWVEFFYFPITSLIIWGMFALWTGEFASTVGRIALVVNVFWSFAYVVQSTINLSINEDSWCGETHHIYITGIGKWGYIISRILFSLLLSAGNFVLMLIVMHFLFFNISNILFSVVLISVITAFLSISMALLTAGLIFALGRDFQWLAWSTLQFFVLLSFPLSSLEILPPGLQMVARVMPFGELFEGIRNLLLGKHWYENVTIAFLLGFVYLFIGLAIYRFGFDHSRKSGKFAKF